MKNKAVAFLLSLLFTTGFSCRQQEEKAAIDPKNNETDKIETAMRCPPVDWLLTSFFIIITHLSKPQTLDVKMPSGSKKPPKAEGSCLLTLILGENGTVYYYYGKAKTNDPASLRQTTGGKDGLQLLLTAHRKQEKGRKDDLITVVIKTTEESTYRHLINVMDDLKISGITRYTIEDMQEADYSLLETYNKHRHSLP